MEPLIALTLDHPPGATPAIRDIAAANGAQQRFACGDSLRVEYQIDAVEPGQIQATEVSVLWFTEGKGEPDMGVHFFCRTMRDEHLDRDLRPMRRIDVELPVSPVSYEGVILKIRWCVRIRLFLSGGREFLQERGFTLGAVPPAVAVVDNGDADCDESEEIGNAVAQQAASQPNDAAQAAT